MNPFFLFVGSLFFLFILSKNVSRNLAFLIYKITKSKNLTINILAFIFLPGTIVHEFSHSAVAQALRVHVGEINLLPKAEGDLVRFGSVQVERTDPLRRFLIGAAPLFVGIVLVFLAITAFQRLNLTSFAYSALLFYILFQIGNTMFSSKKDMEGALELIFSVSLLFTILYFLNITGVFIFISEQISAKSQIFSLGADLILKIIIIDLVVLISAKFLNR